MLKALPDCRPSALLNTTPTVPFPPFSGFNEASCIVAGKAPATSGAKMPAPATTMAANAQPSIHPLRAPDRTDI
ncbi:MAG: hypothetical protein U1F23_06415 [Lysobacterales bacterium]